MKLKFSKLTAWVAVLVIFIICVCSSPKAESKILFQKPVTYEVKGHDVTMGDLNGDGNLDIVTNGVSVLLGNGDGTFQTAVNYDYVVVDAQPSVAIGDMNGDNYPDLVMTIYERDQCYFLPGCNPDLPIGCDQICYYPPGFFAILLGNGDGTFQDAVYYDAGYNPGPVAIGDMNGDGDMDLAITNRTDSDMNENSSNNLIILLGNGDGTFQEARYFSTGLYPQSLALEDLNIDGNLDVAVANKSSENISLLLGNGDGTFQEAVNYYVGAQDISLAFGDLNRDRIPDLAIASIGNNVSVFLGNGDGTLKEAVFYSVGFNAGSIAIGDLDGDGINDLAVSNPDMSILHGNGDGTFQPAEKYEVGDSHYYSLGIGDLNDDGASDIAASDTSVYPDYRVLVLIQEQGSVSPILTIQAEDYNEYADSTPGNAGGQYRNDDVDIWRYGLDTYYVGAVASSENLGYAIDPPLEVAGEYRFSIRYATPKSDRSIWFWFESQELHLTLPNTGAWTKWKTHSTNIFGSGNFISLAIEKGGLNIDWFSLEYLGSGSPTIEPAGGTFNDSVDVTLSTTLAKGTIYYTTDGSQPWESCGPDCGIAGRGKVYTEPFTLTEDTTVRAVVENKYAYSKVSGEAIADFKIVKEQGLTIQAEDYDQGGPHVGYFDRTPGNAGGQYRSDDVDIWGYGTNTYYTGSNATGGCISNLMVPTKPVP